MGSEMCIRDSFSIISSAALDAWGFDVVIIPLDGVIFSAKLEEEKTKNRITKIKNFIESP